MAISFPFMTGVTWKSYHPRAAIFFPILSVPHLRIQELGEESITHAASCLFIGLSVFFLWDCHWLLTVLFWFKKRTFSVGQYPPSPEPISSQTVMTILEQ